MRGKSILFGLVFGWMAVTAFARVERADTLGVSVVATDTVAAVVTDSVAAEVVAADSAVAVSADSLQADSLLAQAPLAVTDSLATAVYSLTTVADSLVAVTDSLGLIAVPDSLVQTTNLAVEPDSFRLDSLGLIDAPIIVDDTLGVGVVEEVKEPVKLYVFVPDSITTLTDSIFALTSGLALLPENVRVLADSVGLALRPMMLVDSTDIFAARVKVLFDAVVAQKLYEEELARKALPDTTLKVKYSELLAKMRADYESKVGALMVDEEKESNPLYFRLFAPLTLYKDPILDAMNYSEVVVQDVEDSLRLAAMISGKDVRLQSELDRTLLATYLDKPTLVKMLEDTLMSSQSVSEDAMKSATEGVKLNVPTANLNDLNTSSTANLAVEMSVAKPNFWKTKGTFSMQFTESYFTENWYQGGANNINMLSTMTLEANYNNKRKVQWNNRLEARIGFYQNEGAEIQSNQDLLRATSSLNLKAIRNWNYTVEAQGNTQMMQHFQSDKITLQSRFLSPVDGTLTIGMSYSKGLKKGSISIFPGPLSYKITYVAVPEVAARYNFEDGKSYRDDIGSKLELRFDYRLAKDITYNTRFYYFTGRYEYVQMDWENTFNFQMNKHLSAKFFFHARFDDSRVKDPKYGYLQFKEYLTFGLNYVW